MRIDAGVDLEGRTNDLLDQSTRPDRAKPSAELNHGIHVQQNRCGGDDFYLHQRRRSVETGEDALILGRKLEEVQQLTERKRIVCRHWDSVAG